jgi:hypothetical protein
VTTLKGVAEYLDQQHEDMTIATYQLLSKNQDKHVLKVTEDEELQQYVNELKHEFEKDLRDNLLLEEEKRERAREGGGDGDGDGKDEDKDEQPKFPKYRARLKLITDDFGKVNTGFRSLMSMPNFLVGLMMASRVGRHYLHCSWFKVTSFNRMMDVHGSVSKETITA